MFILFDLVLENTTSLSIMKLLNCVFGSIAMARQINVNEVQRKYILFFGWQSATRLTIGVFHFLTKVYSNLNREDSDRQRAGTRILLPLEIRIP